MTAIQLFLLSLRLLWRELRGGELRLLSTALVVAVAASCAVGFFTDRVEQALDKRAIAFIGADLVLKTSRPTKIDFPQESISRNLSFSEYKTFGSMVFNNEEMTLASVKVVDNNYPMKGELKITTGDDTIQAVNHPPPPGTVWVEPRLLDTIQAKLGDTVQIGEHELTVTHLLIHEPDRGGGFVNLRPRALMHIDDLAATEVIQPGSRVRYRYLFNGESETLADFRNWLKPQLNPGERFEVLENENRSVSTTLSRAKTYLDLAGLLAVIMAGVSVAMAARQYSLRHFSSAALFRCLGLQQQHILKVFSLQLLTIGLIASAIGVAIGWFGQFGLIHLLASLIPGELPAASLQPGLIGFLTGLLILFGAAFPAILRLSAVSPLRVLRRDLDPLPASAWLIYGLFGLTVVALLYLYSQDIKLTALISIGATALTIVLTILALGLLKLIPRNRGPIVWRLAIANLHRHPKDTLAQLLAFGLTLGAMVLILIVRSDLLERWQAQLPVNAPNNFLINIQPHQIEPLNNFFVERRINHSGIYPMIRGQLSKLNGRSIHDSIKQNDEGYYAIRRELNLTYSWQLGADNNIVEGRWWQPEDKGKTLISVEQDFAQDIGAKLGDEMTFNFGEETVTAKIVSMRTLDWGSFRPNFFVIFQPGNLDGFPSNSITSFYSSDEQSSVLTEMIRSFPTITLLEIGPVIKELRSIVTQVTSAVEYVLVFVLIAGILVVSSALISSLDERLREGALLRVVGGRTNTLRKILLIEFALVGFLAGCLAIIVDEVISFALFTYLFNLPYEPNLKLWVVVPLLGALIVGATGLIGTRKVITHPPLSVFKELS